MRGIFHTLINWLRRPGNSNSLALRSANPTPIGNTEVEHLRNVIAIDENLLERSQAQWQVGDWESLVLMDRETLLHHPDRAKLALLVAAGNFQLGEDRTARQFISLALDWGCSRKLVCQVVASGVHNSLGRAATVMGQSQRATRHFENAVATGTAGSDVGLLARARTWSQLEQVDARAIGVRSPIENSKLSASFLNNNV